MKRLFFVLCLILMSAEAPAMMVRVSLDEMVQESADVVQGRVISRESRWSADRSHIVTEITVEVSESWAGKASAGKTISVQTLGGIVGDDAEIVEHQPAFGANEEVVLFVRPDAQGSARIVQDEQGKFAVGGRYIIGFDLVPQELSSFRQQVSQLLIKQEGPR